MDFGILHRRDLIFPAFLIIVLGLVIYINAINGQFIWDDNLLVKNNIYIRSWQGIKKIFTYDIGAGAGARFNYYRPLQMLTYMCEYAFWGNDPRGYHITNIGLHLLAALSVFWLAFLLCGDRLSAFFTGIIFVCHPLQTESVAYISARGDLLCALFFILSFILYIRYLSHKSAVTYFAMITCYILALLSKENALAFVIVLLLYHYVFKKKLMVKKLLPIAFITLAYAALRLTVIKPTMSAFASICTGFERLPGFFVAIANYLRLLFFPYALHFAYGDKVFRFSEPQAVLGIIITWLLIIYALSKKNKDAVASFSIFWFFATLIPVSGIYPLTAFYMAEHYIYVPSIGFALILATYTVRLYATKTFKVITVFIFGAILIFYGYTTIRQNNYWREPIGFYLKTINFSPDISEVYYNLGYEYLKTNNKVMAAASFKKSVELDPYSAKAYNNLGILYYEFNKKKQSLAFFKKALQINPDSPDALYNLSVAYYYQREYALAIAYCEKAIKLGYKADPDFLSLLALHKKKHK